MSVRALIARLPVPRVPSPGCWPIRWWLPILNATIAGGTLLTLGLRLLSLLEGDLQRQLADYLHNQATPVLEREPGPRPTVSRRGGGRPSMPFKPEPPAKPNAPDKRASVSEPPEPPTNPRLRLLADELIRELAGRDTGIVVYDPRFRVIATSTPGEGAERWPASPRDAVDNALEGREVQRVLRQTSRRTLVLLLPLQEADGNVFGVLEVATSLEFTDRLRMQLGLALGVGTVLAVLVVGGISVWVTRAALGPLQQVVEVTRSVAGGNLGARVRLTRQDEVGELATAFDQMVSRLEAATPSASPR